MRHNALGMIAGRVVSMALGFLFWLLAARLFPARTVGLAAGAVSSMMLCTQLAAFGIGSAFIARFPRHEANPAPLVNTSLTMVGAAAAAVGLLFLGLAAAALDELRIVVESPLFAASFVAMCVLGTVNVVLDQVSIALGRGPQVLSRNIVFGVLAAGALAVVALGDGDATPVQLVLPWVIAGAGACAVGAVQLRRSLPGYRYRPAWDSTLVRDLLSTGLPNHALTLTERAPGFLLPVVVTELLSPTENAYWYAVWMMAWVACIVPLSVGLALFAETARDPASAEAAVRRSTRTSLGLGALAAVAVAVGGQLALRILGREYAESGALPLCILAVSALPMTFVQVYFALCRGLGRLREAITAGVVVAVAGVALAAAVAPSFGLGGMAWAWLAVQVGAGAWAALRSRRLRTAAGTAGPADAPGPAPVPASAV